VCLVLVVSDGSICLFQIGQVYFPEEIVLEDRITEDEVCMSGVSIPKSFLSR
jgi:hypothetical protein